MVKERRGCKPGPTEEGRKRVREEREGGREDQAIPEG